MSLSAGIFRILRIQNIPAHEEEQPIVAVRILRGRISNGLAGDQLGIEAMTAIGPEVTILDEFDFSGIDVVESSTEGDFAFGDQLLAFQEDVLDGGENISAGDG